MIISIMSNKERRAAGHWFHEFNSAEYPAYATLVDPPSLSCLNLHRSRCRVKALLVDDVLDPLAHKNGRNPVQFEVKEGSFVLALPFVTNRDSKHVPAPWLSRVHKIWFVPGDKDSHKEPGGTSAHVVEWEKQQIKKGRVPVSNFKLSVTYFYRWSDFRENITFNRSNVEKLAAVFQRLGKATDVASAERLLEHPGCGGAPPQQFGMRFVIFSTRATHDPPADDDDDGDDNSNDEYDNAVGKDLEDEPMPLEAVMGTAKVSFLGSRQGQPFHPPPSSLVSAAVNSLQDISPDYRQLKPAARQAVEAQAAAAAQGQLPDGFICNMILDYRTAVAEDTKYKSHLYGLEEWAEGRAGTNLSGHWVKTSRKLAQKLLAGTKAELAGQQQQRRQTGAGTSDAAAAAVADSDDHFVDARSNLSGSDDDVQDRTGGAGRQDTAAAAARGGAQQQHRAAAAGGSSGGIQQHQKRRVVAGLEESTSDDDGGGSSSSDDDDKDDNHEDEQPLLPQQQQQQQQDLDDNHQASDSSGGVEFVSETQAPGVDDVTDDDDSDDVSIEQQQQQGDREQQQQSDTDDDEGSTSESEDDDQQQQQSVGGDAEAVHPQSVQQQQVPSSSLRAAPPPTVPAAVGIKPEPSGNTAAAASPSSSKRKQQIPKKWHGNSPLSAAAVKAFAANAAAAETKRLKEASSSSSDDDDVGAYLSGKSRAAAAAGSLKQQRQKKKRRKVADESA